MNTKGLTQKEASEKLKEFGLNELKEVNKNSAWKILFRQVKKNFVIYLLTLTAIASFFLDEPITGYVIMAVISIVILTGYIQEYKAEQAINALRKMIMPVSRVMRDGKEHEINSNEIVPSDIIILRTGEKVPADCIVLDEANLKVNEAILTGESSDVKKTAASSEENYSEDNMVYMGSFVVNGKCIAKVIKTGMNTKFGKIADMISTAEKHLPLQDKVNRISFYMILVGITAALLTGTVMFFRADVINPEVIIHILIIVIALSVSSFPEGFPVVLTTTLANGVNKMAKQNAVINRMSIIETLGETSVICSDKTGTLTKGEMTIRKMYAGDKEYDVTGIGYEAHGEITENGKKVDPQSNTILSKIINAGVICNDSNIEREGTDGIYNVIGSATEGALLILAAKVGLFKESFSSERIEEIPFDSKRKMMSVLYSEENKKVVYAKGAPEVLLEKCSSIQTPSGTRKMTEKDREEILAMNKKFAKGAYRSLAFAYKSNKADTYQEDDLTFLGLVGMEDPPREEAKDAIALCLQSGIKVKMITGDHKETAQAIAAQIGIEGDVITGDELDKLSDDELKDIVLTTAIFARVKPEDKLRIVKALKEHKEIVTMTGDGVNDAPALKEAHIGVAMGINGTDVTRSVADITLKDDNFVTIVAAIKEGRTIFNNIRKFVTYQLSCNFSDICIIFSGMLVAPFLGWYTPLITALQILFMNIVTDNMPAITLGFNPTSKDIMKAKPRKNTQILTKQLFLLMILNGGLMGAISFGMAFLSFNVLDMPDEVARTTVLVGMILMQIANAFNFRSFRYGVLNKGIFVNKYLVFASLVSLSVTFLIIYTPLNHVFETTSLGLESWLIAVGSVLAIVGFFDIYKKIFNMKALIRGN